MRAILLDWMNVFCAENNLKRDTFNKSIYFVDKYMETTSNIRQEYFQLVGLVAISLASKLEEIKTLMVSELEKSAEGAYSGE